jgi:hypothetical protein
MAALRERRPMHDGSSLWVVFAAGCLCGYLIRAAISATRRRRWRRRLGN